MRSRFLIPGVAVVLGALGAAAPLTAQNAPPFKIDQAAAQWGEHQWKTRQCTGCHELGRKQSTGPDLIGVNDRRSVEWLRHWLKNPVQMAQQDSVAAALKKQFGSQMPNLDLSDRDVEGLINYLAVLTQERRGGH
jgi:mono/diheme cytochrome c family protein